MFSQNLGSSSGSTGRKLGSMLTSISLHCLILAILVVAPLVLAECGLLEAHGFSGKTTLTDLSYTSSWSVKQQTQKQPAPPHTPPEEVVIVRSNIKSKIQLPVAVPMEASGQPVIFQVPGFDFDHGPCGCVPHYEPRRSDPLGKQVFPVAPGRRSYLQPPVLVRKVDPEYPLSARRAGIQGRIVMHAIIDREGSITGITEVSGPQELRGAAIVAVRRWRYQPYLLDGVAIEVETTITVNFVLGKSSRQALSRIMW